MARRKLFCRVCITGRPIGDIKVTFWEKHQHMISQKIVHYRVIIVFILLIERSTIENFLRKNVSSGRELQV